MSFNGRAPLGELKRCPDPLAVAWGRNGNKWSGKGEKRRRRGKRRGREWREWKEELHTHRNI